MFCPKCGTQVPDNSQTCHVCGNQFSQQYQNPNPNPNFTANISYDDVTIQFDPNDIAYNKSTAWLSYLGLLFLIPLFANKNSPFARFHVNQGILLFIIEIAIGIVINIFSWVPIIRNIISLAGGLLYLAVFIFGIIGLINAAQGKAKELPLVGKIRILK